jgi:hypothetical protein
MTGILELLDGWEFLGMVGIIKCHIPWWDQ